MGANIKGGCCSDLRSRHRIPISLPQHCCRQRLHWVPCRLLESFPLQRRTSTGAGTTSRKHSPNHRADNEHLSIIEGETHHADRSGWKRFCSVSSRIEDMERTKRSTTAPSQIGRWRVYGLGVRLKGTWIWEEIDGRWVDKNQQWETNWEDLHRYSSRRRDSQDSSQTNPHWITVCYVFIHRCKQWGFLE